MRIHALDGLRALAALLVVVHHLGGSSLGEGMFGRLISTATASGVELFFVLSGVVLARRYIRDGVPMTLLPYFSRRAKRLLPPYLVAWLLAGATVLVTTLRPTWWTVTAALPSFDIADWASQALILNWWTPHYNFAWWSLTTEVAFYLLLPALILVLAATHRLVYALPLIFAGAIALSFAGFSAVDIPVVRELVTYATCFISGLVLASRDIGVAVRMTAIVAGAATVVTALFTPINPHVGWGLLYFGVVAWALDEASVLSRQLSRLPLVWLGERSYSLFLTHFSVITLICWAVSIAVPEKGLLYFALTRALALPLSLLTAMLLFSYVERRFAKGLVTAEMFWPPISAGARLAPRRSPST